MAILSNRPKSKEGKGSPFRIVVLIILAACSAYAIYNTGLEAGLKQTGFASTLLLNQATETGTVYTKEELPQVKETAPVLEVLPNVLAIPAGEAQALPSIRIEDPNEDDARTKGGTKYGGAGDKAHLGGFTLYDGNGVSPAVWNDMLEYVGVKSLMDVGCGKGLSTLYFYEQGADVLCVEGSHDAVQQTYLPDPAKQVVEHDFSRGPYWPGKTYDAVWSVEFLEHVGRNYHFNYIQTFRKAALIFVTHSRWGGWHHVEVHRDEWWRQKFEMYGFQYSELLTNRVREVARNENNNGKKNPTAEENLGPDGQPYNGQHIWLTMMVFVNPAVAALPQHAHLMAEKGCYENTINSPEGRKIIQRDCLEEKKESVLPEEFAPVEVTRDKYNAWFNKVKARVNPEKQ